MSDNLLNWYTPEPRLEDELIRQPITVWSTDSQQIAVKLEKDPTVFLIDVASQTAKPFFEPVALSGCSSGCRMGQGFILRWGHLIHHQHQKREFIRWRSMR